MTKMTSNCHQNDAQAINKPSPGFARSDEALVERLSVLAGISVRNAVIHEEMKTSEQKTKSLVEVVKVTPPPFPSLPCPPRSSPRLHLQP